LAKQGAFSKFTRRKPANVLTLEDEGRELSLDTLTIEDGIIRDRLKNRSFVRADKPIYISIEKDFKRGRYPFYLQDNNGGCTVTLKRAPTAEEQANGATEITEKFEFKGAPATLVRPKVEYEIVTNAEGVYNLIDNKLLFSLLSVRPQMWQLLVTLVLGAILGFFIKAMWR
jgi:hypothetical protein